MTAVVIGGVNVDVLAKPSGPLAASASTPGRIRIGPGGAGRNVAENLARLGVTTALIASVDAGPLSDLALSQTAQAGVDVSGVVRVRDLGNYYVGIHDDGGVRWAVSEMAAAEALTPGDLDARASLIRDADAVVVDANLHPAAIARAAELTPPSRLCLLTVSAAKAGRLRAALAGARLLVAGAPEAEVLAGTSVRSPEDAMRAARSLAASSQRAVIITAGDLGQAWVGPGLATWFDAAPTAVVDPTGAGDAVAAVAVHGLVRGLPPEQTARLAMAAAAMTLGVEGATHPGLSLEALHARS